MNILCKIANILVECLNHIARALCYFSNNDTLHINYMDTELLSKYLHIGTKVELVDWYQAESIRIATLNFNEGISKYLGNVVTIGYIDTDGTFAIYEDEGRYWYDLEWIKNIKQRTE